MDTGKNDLYDLITSLHRLEFILQHKSDSILRDSIGVGFGQVQIMQAIHGSGMLSQRALARKLYQTEANISRQLRLLKNKGMASINRNKKDRRVREIMLTAKGAKTYEKAQKILSGQYEELLRLMDERERKAFGRAVSHLLKAV